MLIVQCISFIPQRIINAFPSAFAERNGFNTYVLFVKQELSYSVSLCAEEFYC